MNFVYLVAILAIFQYFVFVAMVGRARVKYGVKAPATTGNEHFERVYRIQINTLEQLIGFLPALFLASLYWSNGLVATIGVVYLIGRFLYWQRYLKDPRSRGPGFILTILPTFILLLAALIGVFFR